jgi:hypothetical protein
LGRAEMPFFRFGQVPISRVTGHVLLASISLLR